ncbi:MAG: tRNA (N(6)-L-threonylcarbamoyladenosine(37)-C(2))-methylthiotransferase MtaB [bacterium]
MSRTSFKQPLRVSFRTLGCKVNQYETAAMKNRLARAGCEIVPQGDRADICVINTCTVTGKSDVSSRQMVRQAIRRNSGSRVIVTGCYAQSDPESLRKIEGVSQVIGNQEKQRLLEIISGQKEKEANLPAFGNRSRAFVMVQDGCDARCSYCIVPLVRGKPLSRSVAEIRSEVKGLGEAGFKEFVLSGIHIGAYRDLRKSLSDLLEELFHVLPEPGRVRLSSIEPNEVNSGLIEQFRHPKLCRHLHLPLQSGSDRILNLMKRRYTAGDYRTVVNRVTEAVPGIGLGTDVMVGFPGETDRDFLATCRLLEELPFSYLHVFPYSPRPGTEAADLKNRVPAELKRERSAFLRDLGARKKSLYQQKALGGIFNTVLIKKEVSGKIKGLTDNYLEVEIAPEKISWPQARNSIVAIKTTCYNKGLLSGSPVCL